MNLSPLDSRYRALNPVLFDRLAEYLSEAASIRFCGQIEVALAKTLTEYRVAPPGFGESVEEIVEDLDFSEVYQEEQRIHHNIRALVNCISKRLPSQFVPYVHLFATSADILDSARALQYKKFTAELLIPTMKRLLDLLYERAATYRDTPQVGRTHGRYAEPTTFGYSMAWHAVRLEGRLELLYSTSVALIGKLSGAVGTRAATKLGIDKSLKFESDVLAKVGLESAFAGISTQIVQPEMALDYFHAATSAFGVLASIADDFRHLMRSDIGEIEETDVPDRVGSSTMPHKINPKDFENVKSFWKAYCPRMVTNYMDQISEHQRDLTNSASQRIANETLAALAFAGDRLHTAITGTVVNSAIMAKNLQMSTDDVSSEPLYVGLALNGLRHAHEAIRKLTRKRQNGRGSLLDIAESDSELNEYVSKMSHFVRESIAFPDRYIGDASESTRLACERWETISKPKWDQRLAQS